MKSLDTEDLGRLIALAEMLSEEGQMNLNKLIEAAVFAQLRWAGWRQLTERAENDLLGQLQEAMRLLERADVGQELLAALQAGCKHLEEGTSGDLAVETAPDAFVCRSCGHLSLGKAPVHCPVCGAWPGRFRRFVAMFNGDNYEPIDPTIILDLLVDNAEQLAELTHDLSEDLLQRRPDSDTWSIREHVSHFYDTQEMLERRMDLILNEEEPDLSAAAPYISATENTGRPSSTQEIMERFCTRRKDSVAYLRKRSLTDLWRSGNHPEFGRISLLRQLCYFAFHEQSHLPAIETLRTRYLSVETAPDSDVG